MKKLCTGLGLVVALIASPSFAAEEGVLEKARDGTQKGVDVVVGGVKKGADATTKGFEKAGKWVEKKTGRKGNKDVPKEPPLPGKS